MRTGIFSALFTLIAMVATVHADPAVTPLESRPGNVVLLGMDLTVRLPEPADAKAPPEPAWQATDYEAKVVKEGRSEDGLARLGQLPVGHYEVRRKGSKASAAAAVLAPLKVRPSVDSPICIDVAMAWFYKKEQMPAVANLCALAGVGRVRDRLNWSQLEPAAGSFAPPGVYDDSAAAQSAAGLAILQTNHVTPTWANPDPKRFPPDLRDTHRFHRAMAERWRGRVTAFEPWNEADIDMFGGHTGSEMASLQKAAFLGIKAGNPDAIACMNVFAVSREQTLADLDANEPSPYFDTFNLHHYAGVEKFPQIYSAFRRVAAGKPMWTTEFQILVKWEGDPAAKELSEANQRLQAERVPVSFAAGLHEGPVAMFYFVLPHYAEEQTQYGLLHTDLTPRPAYVALAAVGRLLAEAKPAGRLDPAPPGVTGFLFNAKPDGAARVVLVAWAGDAMNDAPGDAARAAPREVDLHLAPLAVFDHLGRTVPVDGTIVRLGRAPVYVLLPVDAASRLAAAPGKPVPPRAAPAASPAASPIVLQAVMTREQIDLDNSALRVPSLKPTSLSVFAYNFSDKPARGLLSISPPGDWKITVPQTLELAPGERKRIEFTLDCNGATPERVATLRLSADMGGHGRAVLSFRVMPQPRIVPASSLVPLKDAADVKRFTPDASPGAKATLQPSENGVAVDAALIPGDRWIYPRLDLQPTERAPAGAKSFRMRVKAIEGNARFRVLFVKSNGAIYVGDSLDPQPKPGETLDLIFDIASAGFGKGFSPPDPDGRLTPQEIVALKIGCNAVDGRVRYEVGDFNWVK
ncbi:MAG: hypothetical protein NTW19_03945 [Planctomycetota bacterium]|nr:hypothetical protein [Planctomycetota bacterium]